MVKPADIPQSAEGALGKRDVASSILVISSNSIMRLGSRERGNSIDTKVRYQLLVIMPLSANYGVPIGIALNTLLIAQTNP